MTTSDFIDDQATVNARIAQHEARLGLPKSEPLDDIARANTILRGLELMPTPTTPKAALPVPTTPPPAPTAPPPKVDAPALTAMQRTAQSFASHQPPTRSNPPKAADGELHGVMRMAAFYARNAQPTSKA